MGRVHVAGSVNMDVSVRVERRPEPGETVAGEDLDFGLGGKGANQAVAAARLGADVGMVGRVGDDEFGAELLDRLDREPLSLDRVRRVADASTGTALITVDADSENAIVVVPGANGTLSPADVRPVAFDPGDVAVSQFEVPQPAVRAFFEAARDAGATTVLNPAPAAEFRESIPGLVDYLVVNETEAAFYGGGRGSGTRERTAEADLLDACERVRAHDEQTVVVTLGAEGVLASGPEETVRLDGHDVDPVDTTGAGDAFVGALAAALEDGRDLRDALAFANAAGAVATTAAGAAPSLPTRAEVRAFLSNR
ncbi:MAG: ribokinase [Haloarculaceae archaeon]